jgi:hypothetical protein
MNPSTDKYIRKIKEMPYVWKMLWTLAVFNKAPCYHHIDLLIKAVEFLVDKENKATVFHLSEKIVDPTLKWNT